MRQDPKTYLPRSRVLLACGTGSGIGAAPTCTLAAGFYTRIRMGNATNVGVALFEGTPFQATKGNQKAITTPYLFSYMPMWTVAHLPNHLPGWLFPEVGNEPFWWVWTDSVAPPVSRVKGFGVGVALLRVPFWGCFTGIPRQNHSLD